MSATQREVGQVHLQINLDVEELLIPVFSVCVLLQEVFGGQRGVGWLGWRFLDSMLSTTTGTTWREALLHATEVPVKILNKAVRKFFQNTKHNWMHLLRSNVHQIYC